ncbi:PAS domain S-box protein [uncultured Methanolobus sp.]|uniref:PAS domain S-box protein n=1 Tax=uncultured Methanolobus sp. TaxID=218300 RepID=UPI002AAAB129|nr:PAS domain S-box protein [uncultured Methanolobus sp.]
MNSEENKKLKKLVAYSEELFQSSADEPDYNRITEMMKDISGARYAAFILFDENIDAYITKSIQGTAKHIKKASEILNFDLRKRLWDRDKNLEDKIKNNIITHFSSIHELTEGSFPGKPIILLEKTFNVGHTIIANIFRNSPNMGYFVLIYSVGEDPVNEEIIEVLSRQVGLLLERKKTEEKLRFQFRYQKMISEISSRFLRISDNEVDDAIDEALQACRELFDVEGAYAFLFSDDREILVKSYECLASGIKSHASNIIGTKLSDNPWFEKNIKENEHIYVSDIDEMPQEAEAYKNGLKQYSVKSFLHIPLTEQSDVIGFIGFSSVNKRIWSEEQIELLKVLAGIISSALEKRAEREELQIQKKRLSEAQRIGHTGSWEFDMNTGMVHASREAINIYGIEDTGATIREVQALVLPQFRSSLDQSLKDLIGLNKPYHVEFSICRPLDNEIRHISSVAEYYPDRNTVVGTLQDITERKEAEKKIAEREVWKHELIKNSMDGIVVLDLQGGVYEANQCYADMLGYSLEEVKKLHIWDWDVQIGREKFLRMSKRMHQDIKYIETLHKRKDGKILNMEISSSNAKCGEQELVFCVCRDITERKRSEEQLQNRTQMLDMALEATCAGIWDVDLLTGNIELQGLDSWKKITGYDIEDFSEYNLSMWEELIHPEDAEEVVSKFSDTASCKNDHYLAEYRMLHKNGHWVWIRAHGRISGFSKDGRPLHVYGTHISIDENKKAEEKAKAASQAKSDFLANMSHEIRTPLNGIIGFSDLLINSQPVSSQLQYLQTINASANSLLDLINDVLDISKIEAGKLELVNEKVDLRELCEQINDMLKYSAHAKGLELLSNLSPRLPDFIVADRMRLRQVLVNLLGNAIKFTSAGEVELKVIAGKTDIESKADITFSVRDTGIGIPPDKQTDIYDSFSQADSSISRKYGGTGLGLSISNKLLEKMYSELELTSEEGKGSCFSFTVKFPVETMELSYEEKTKNVEKILIVDDNEKNCHIIGSILENAGINTEIAHSAEETLKICKELTDSIDLMIMDQHMSLMNGDELVREIRKGNTCYSADMPVIIMQDSTDMVTENEHKEDSSINKRSVHIIKPVKQRELLESIVNIMSEGEGNISEERCVPELPDDRHGGKYSILIAEDNEVNMLLASTFVSRILPEAKVFKAKDGKDAVRLFGENIPDLVLMDIQMPELNGYDATVMIRNIEKTRGTHTPIIALTAGTFREEKDKCFEAGLDDYIPKPIIFDNIRQLFDKWLFKQYEENENEKQKEHSLDPVHFDSEWLSENTNGSKELYDDIAAMAMKSFVRSHKEMCAAFSINDMDRMATIAHKTRGTALNTGFNVMASSVEDIENAAKNDPENVLKLLEKMEEEIEYLIRFFDKQNQ